VTLVDHPNRSTPKTPSEEATRLYDEIMYDIDMVLEKDARNTRPWQWSRIRTLWTRLDATETYYVVLLPSDTEFDDLKDAEFDEDLTVLSEASLDEYCFQHLNDVIDIVQGQLAEDPESRVTVGMLVPHAATQVYGDERVQFLVLPVTVTRPAFAH
jgi:hypothetical protein